MHYLTILGIKDPIHKQKISLKAMDVVLFGPPKGNYKQSQLPDTIIFNMLHNNESFNTKIKLHFE